MVKLSKRMQAAANLLPEGKRFADIGTDHGYLPIYMVGEKHCPHALAMDINAGPLERAREHIMQYEMQPYIEIRRSDGFEKLKPKEAECILIAGMGGRLVMHILEQGQHVVDCETELVLQPQSELSEVRKYLRVHGYRTLAEDMVEEDGKFYPMMKVQKTDAKEAGEAQMPSSFEQQVYDLYGELLIKSKHPVLKKYLEKEHRNLQNISEQMRHAMIDEGSERSREIEERIKRNRAAFTWMEER